MSDMPPFCNFYVICFSMIKRYGKLERFFNQKRTSSVKHNHISIVLLGFSNGVLMGIAGSYFHVFPFIA
eukprot:Gb_26127 [translate_table: standard]